MMMKKYAKTCAMRCAVVVLLATGFGQGVGVAQTTLQVDSLLRESDLNAGGFKGQLFTLGSDLTIEVNDGGRVDDLGTTFPVATPFSFVGSTVNVNSGGLFGSQKTLIADVQLNIFEGGRVNGVSAFGGVTVNVLGGELRLPLEVAAGATVLMSSGRITGTNQGLSGGLVTVTGGVLGRGFVVESGGVLSVSGGLLDEKFEARPGSDVTLSGGEFQLNGAGVANLNGGLPFDGVFTGTLADGSVFILGQQAFDAIAPGTTTLVSAPLAPIDTTPKVVSAGTESGGLRAGQVLTLIDGGSLGDHFAVVGATLNVNGGVVGENLEVANGTLNISGGQIGSRANLVGDSISLFSGSVVNISGGLFADQLQPLAGSTVDISGGVFEDGIRGRRGSDITLRGGDFQLSGSAITDLDSGVPVGGVLTGTFADGSVFIFSEQAFETFPAGTTSLVSSSLAPPDTTPQIISAGVGPQGLRPGQTLTLRDGGSLGDNFVAVGSTLNIEGGTVGDFARIAYSQVEISGGIIGGRGFSVYDGATINMTGGEIAGSLDAFAGSVVTIAGGSVQSIVAQAGAVTIDAGTVGTIITTDGGTILIRGGSVGVGPFPAGSILDGTVTITGGELGSFVSVGPGTLNISGGSVGDRLRASFNGLINVSGGVVGDDFHAGNLSTVNITGGSIGSGFRADFGSIVNISGGGFGPAFTAQFQSEVNLFVLELLLDGTPIGLDPGVLFTIPDRDGALLTAILADGSNFALTLNQNNQFGQDWIDTNAVLTATLVPEPASLLLLAGGGVLMLCRRRIRLERPRIWVSRPTGAEVHRIRA